MKIINILGPKVPWGTPDKTGMNFDLVIDGDTLWSRSKMASNLFIDDLEYQNPIYSLHKFAMWYAVKGFLKVQIDISLWLCVSGVVNII